MNSTPDSNDQPDSDGLYGNNLSDLFRCALDATAPTPQAQPWQPPTVEHLAELLPQYQVEKLIGRGGMGAVYQGVQVSLKRQVAIKLLPAELAANTEFISRFQREAQTLARLQHPGIVAVHDFGQTAEGHLYFIMEFVDGTDLMHIIHGPGLEPTQALEITIQVCEALHYSHSQGVIHRDIKPANVLVTKDGRAKLADFGLARPLSTMPSGVTAASLVMGTPDYMAPEQWAGKADHRADIYSLGVMLYEMLTGSRPQGVFDLPSIRSQVDARRDEVVIKAMRQEPERRYQQVSELREAVNRIRTTEPPRLAQEPAFAPPRTAKQTLPARNSRRRHSALDVLGWSVAAFFLIVLAGLLFLFWPNKKSVSPVAATVTVNDQGEKASSHLPIIPQPAPPIVIPKAEPPPAPATAQVTPTSKIPEAMPPAKLSVPAPTTPVSIPTPAAPTIVQTPIIQVFTREAQNLISWALAPLEETVPPDIRQKLTYLREDLIDEGKVRPSASLDAYRAAFYLCEDLLTALNERDQARVAAGYRAAQTAAAQPIGNQALDARRNYLMSWPQHSREESQRAALSNQSQARTVVSSEAHKVAWATKAERLRASLDARYRTFRSAMRQ